MQVSCETMSSCSNRHGPFMLVIIALCHAALWADKTVTLTSAVITLKPLSQHGLHSLIQFVLHQSAACFILTNAFACFILTNAFACCAETPEGPDQQAVLQPVSRAS